MNKLPRINIERYNEALNNHYPIDYMTCFPKTLKQLIKGIEKEKNPLNFRGDIMTILQLYFDGLIDNTPWRGRVSKGNKEKTKTWAKQKRVLDKIYETGKNVIASFYRGQEIDFDGAKEGILPYASDIIKYGAKKRGKQRHLEGKSREVQDFGLRLPKIFENLKLIDTIICVASGGFEPSFLCMDITGKEQLMALRHSKDKFDQRPRYPTYMPKDYLVSAIRDKNVLVIEDWVFEGESLAKTMNLVKKFSPSELYGTSVIGGGLPEIEVEAISKDPFLCRYKI